MKITTPIISLVALVLLSAKTNAQIQISADDVYSRGKYQMTYDTTGGFDPGTPGANKTWDFSKLKNHNAYESYITGYSGPVTDANLIEMGGVDTFSYFQKTESGISMILPLQDFGKTEYQKLKAFNFPLKLNNTLKDSISMKNYYTGDDFGMPFIDSLRLTFKIAVSTNADAWGTLKIPMGSFNALRIKTETHTVAKMEGKTGKLPYVSIPDFDQDEVETSYAWFTNNKGHYIASYYPLDDEMEYMVSSLSVNNAVSKNTDIKVNNPFNDQLILKNNSNTNYLITLIDLSGKQIFNQKIEPNSTTTMDASQLPSGVYNLQLLDMKNKTVSFQKLIK